MKSVTHLSLQFLLTWKQLTLKNGELLNDQTWPFRIEKSLLRKVLLLIFASTFLKKIIMSTLCRIFSTNETYYIQSSISLSMSTVDHQCTSSRNRIDPFYDLKGSHQTAIIHNILKSSYQIAIIHNSLNNLVLCFFAVWCELLCFRPYVMLCYFYKG